MLVCFEKHSFFKILSIKESTKSYMMALYYNSLLGQQSMVPVFCTLEGAFPPKLLLVR